MAVHYSNYFNAHTEVLLGWNVKRAGIGVDCVGYESLLLNCNIHDVSDSSCQGGATTISCLAFGVFAFQSLLYILIIKNHVSDDCEGFTHNYNPNPSNESSSQATCFNR